MPLFENYVKNNNGFYWFFLIKTICNNPYMQ